ncbi:MAG: sulfatase-like hydrolase/transferase [Pseudolabrys sp.]
MSVAGPSGKSWTAGLAAVLASPRTRLAAIAALHLAALIMLYRTEYGWLAVMLALLTWGLLNFFLLTALRRPALSAALSLALVLVLILASQFKFGILDMTASFLDILIIDPDTLTFWLSIYPNLYTALPVGAAAAIPLIVLLWWVDPFRVRRRRAAAGFALCLTGIVGLSLSIPERPWEPFGGVNHVSNFTRSAVAAVSELGVHGWIESARAAGHLQAVIDEPCPPAAKLPHIIMVLDESSFDITAAPGIKVPEGYHDHFRSYDGKSRGLVMESTGGPTWYAEYNVLTGLSVRSYGRLMFNVTRIAADRVERGLPLALKRCGYRTFSNYPAHGAFLSARRFQTTAGIDTFIDLKDMGIPNDLQPDKFYYDFVGKLIEREHSAGPLFAFVYVTANHFPWTWQFRPELTPGWTGLGNSSEVDEYIRRQTLSAGDYSNFLARLKVDFPNDSFLVVRFGDHQPAISSKILEPGLDAKDRATRIMNYDARYFTTYYAIDTVNFTPADVSSAFNSLDAAFLPLAIQEAAGVPLDASFVEQKQILQRCQGRFYSCADGAEARRFNRLLIDAGLIKGL